MCRRVLPGRIGGAKRSCRWLQLRLPLPVEGGLRWGPRRLDGRWLGRQRQAGEDPGYGVRVEDGGE